MNPTLVVELSGDKTLEPHHLGGKAHSLNHLIQAGLPVPPAFCITAQAYRQFIEFAVPGAQLDTGAPGNVRDMILSAAIPAPLDLAIRHACKQLGDGASLAVRSSALEEDGLTHSFAGQYDTYLHVRGDDEVVRKVQSCWASLWAERAAQYSRTSAAQSDIAVVLQIMVDADAAGVMFTQDPLTGDANHIVIDSCWGLGKAWSPDRSPPTASFWIRRAARSASGKFVTNRTIANAILRDRLRCCKRPKPGETPPA